MIEPPDRCLLLARMEASQAETQRHLGIIERQIVARAERLTITDRAKRRHYGRSASSWTNADERLIHQHAADLALARRGEIDALTRKLDRQEEAIAELRTRNRDSASMLGGEAHPQAERRRCPRTHAGDVERLGVFSPDLPRFRPRMTLGRSSLGLCCGLNRPRSASRASREAIGGRRLAMGGRVLRRPEGPLGRNPPMLALAAGAP